MDKQSMKLAGLTDKEIHLLCTPFSNLSVNDRSACFSASDKVAEYNRKQPLLVDCSAATRMTDKLFDKGHIVSPADGKAYGNRQQWNEMLKRNNCVEFGNDIKPKARKQEFKDMKLKPAIAEAMKKAGMIKV